MAPTFFVFGIGFINAFLSAASRNATCVYATGDLQQIKEIAENVGVNISNFN